MAGKDSLIKAQEAINKAGNTADQGFNRLKNNIMDLVALSNKVYNPPKNQPENEALKTQKAMANSELKFRRQLKTFIENSSNEASLVCVCAKEALENITKKCKEDIKAFPLAFADLELDESLTAQDNSFEEQDKTASFGNKQEAGININKNILNLSDDSDISLNNDKKEDKKENNKEKKIIVPKTVKEESEDYSDDDDDSYDEDSDEESNEDESEELSKTQQQKIIDDIRRAMDNAERNGGIPILPEDEPIEDYYNQRPTSMENALENLKSNELLPYYGREELKKLKETATDALKSYNDYKNNPDSDENERDYNIKYCAFLEAYNKFAGIEVAEEKEDVKAGLVDPEVNLATIELGLNNRINTSRRENIVFLKNGFDTLFTNKKDYAKLTENIPTIEKYTADAKEELSKSKLGFKDLIKMVEKSNLGAYKNDNRYKRIMRDLKALDVLDRELVQECETNAERLAKRKSILLIENRVKNEAEQYMQALKTAAEIKKMGIVNCEKMTYHLENITHVIARKISYENKRLDSYRPKKSSVKDDYLKVSEIDAKKIDEESEIDEFNIGNPEELRDELGKAKEFGFELDHGNNIFADEPDIDLDEEKSFIDMNDDNSLENKTIQKEELNGVMKKVYVDDMNDELEEYNAIANGINKKTGDKKKKESNKELRQAEYHIEVYDIQNDMLEMLKMGNKKVHMGTKEYDRLISTTEQFVRIKAEFDKDPHNNKAYRDLLQVESKLNAQMDKYLERKRNEIKSAEDRDKLPNFNSLRRYDLVRGLRDELTRIREMDIDRNPNRAIENAINIEDERRKNTREPLTYKEFRKSVLATFYLTTIKNRFGNSKEKLREYMRIGNYRNAVSSMEKAMEGTEFDAYLKRMYKKKGAMAFSVRNSRGQLNEDAISALRSTLSSMQHDIVENDPKHIFDADEEEFAEKCRNYDNMVGISKFLGFASVLEQRDFKLHTAKIIADNEGFFLTHYKEQKMQPLKEGGVIVDESGNGNLVDESKLEKSNEDENKNVSMRNKSNESGNIIFNPNKNKIKPNNMNIKLNNNTGNLKKNNNLSRSSGMNK